jgi:hypothetical protein
MNFLPPLPHATCTSREHGAAVAPLPPLPPLPHLPIPNAPCPMPHAQTMFLFS